MSQLNLCTFLQFTASSTLACDASRQLSDNGVSGSAMTELAYDIARGASFKFNTMFLGSVVRCAILNLRSQDLHGFSIKKKQTNQQTNNSAKQFSSRYGTSNPVNICQGLGTSALALLACVCALFGSMCRLDREKKNWSQRPLSLWLARPFVLRRICVLFVRFYNAIDNADFGLSMLACCKCSLALMSNE